MRRRTLPLLVALLLAVLAAVLMGCEVVSHGGDLPSNRAEADARYHDPWRGMERPPLGDEMRRGR